MRVFRVLPAILDLNQASSMADSDVGKLFLGGISRDTSEATLGNHFSKYGEVSSSIIAKDRITGTPRGFGFVTFSDPSSVDKALQDHHVIGGRTVSFLFQTLDYILEKFQSFFLNVSGLCVCRPAWNPRFFFVLLWYFCEFMLRLCVV